MKAILFFSSYPSLRVKEESDGLEMGVIGTANKLQNVSISTQPIASFDWSPDKVRPEVFD